MLTYNKLGLVGRLGNALFEFASTVGFADMGKEPVVFPEVWEYRPFFSIPDHMFGDCSLADDIVQYISYLDPRARPYLQDYNLFAGVEEKLRHYLSPSPEARVALEQQTGFWSLRRPILSVHVRRGDNVPGNDPATPDKHLYHPLPNLDYYQRGIAAYKNDYASLAVFSDDIGWCQENIPADFYHGGLARSKEHEPQHFTEPVLDWIGLFLMAECDVHLLSNSTYGWWGAFLSKDRTPLYIDPWFGPLVSEYTDARLMFPSTWRPLERGVQNVDVTA